jgi:hypothetical protein
MRPCVTRISRFVDTVTVRSISAYISVAHTRVNDVRIGVGYRNGSHRTQCQLIISDRIPMVSTVYCLKDASARSSHIKDKRLGLHSCHRSRASVTKRANLSKLNPAKRRVRSLLLCLLRSEWKAADNETTNRRKGENSMPRFAKLFRTN